MIRHVIVAYLLASVLFAPFAYCARLTEMDVVALAKEAAEKAGYSLEEYREPTVNFELYKAHEWVLTFRSKINRLVHFFVTVDDETGRTEILPGE